MFITPQEGHTLGEVIDESSRHERLQGEFNIRFGGSIATSGAWRPPRNSRQFDHSRGEGSCSHFGCHGRGYGRFAGSSSSG